MVLVGAFVVAAIVGILIGVMAGFIFEIQYSIEGSRREMRFNGQRCGLTIADALFR